MSRQISSIEDLYEITKAELLNKYGSVQIHFNNRSIPYMSNDIIGNCLQEWLPNWFNYIGVNIEANPQTQTFPDFWMTISEKVYDFEIKCWNSNNSPAFDLANFNSFVSTVYDDPEQLNAYYFILGYRPTEEGVDFEQGFQVDKIYLKRIWEMCGPTKYPISIQIKKGQPYALRPSNFANPRTEIFDDRKSYVSAIAKLIDMYPNDAWVFNGTQWFNHVQEKYESTYGEPL